jgi:elongation factor 1 alpha-like protein
VTIDVAQTKFETEKKIIYLLDAPGHKDFIPNMITGATQADSAILVINSVTGEFETGFDLGGQTREHSLLAKSLGISQLIVAVNKMDMCEWSEPRFRDICRKLGAFLTKQVGFKEQDVVYVPCSGLAGENLTTRCANSKLTDWYTEALTLLDCVNGLRAQERPIDKSLRFCISDVYKSAQSAAISVAGKVETGLVRPGDRVCIVPCSEVGQVKSISLSNDEQGLTACYAGDSVILNLTGVDMSNITVGNFVCDLSSPPMPVADKIRARIIVFNLELPLIKGFPVNCFIFNFFFSIFKIFSNDSIQKGDFSLQIDERVGYNQANCFTDRQEYRRSGQREAKVCSKIGIMKSTFVWILDWMDWMI